MPTPPALLDPEHRRAIVDAARVSEEDVERIHALYVRGTSPNTVRALESDLQLLLAWKLLSFGEPLAWPEREEVAIRFILDHAEDLDRLSADSRARRTAEALIEMGLRRTLKAPAPSTLDRRIASWRTLHRLRNLASPFDTPIVRTVRAKALKVLRSRKPGKKSELPITMEMMDRMLDVASPDMRGLRDRAILAVGFASGGRRRSELAALRREDVDLRGFDEDGTVRLELLGTKTTDRADTPALFLKGLAARLLVAWIAEGGIADGFLFRRISRTDRVLKHGLTGDGIGQIVKRLARAAGIDPAQVSAHGLRSGFLTQAALDGVPIQAAMRMSLHRSAPQAMAYYGDVEMKRNPAMEVFRRRSQADGRDRDD